MSEIEIINISNNKKKYLNLIDHNKFNNFNNIYNNYKYLILNGKNIFNFSYKLGENIWLNNFIINKVNKVFLDNKNIEYFNVESPYGYYGPYSNSNNKDFINEANRYFENWCLDKNIIAEFIRFNPLIKNKKIRNNIDCELNRTTLSYDLLKFNKEKNIFNSKIMNQINNYKNHEINIIKTSEKEDFYKFIEIYKLKMISLNANKFYLFSDQYYESLFNLIIKNGFIILAKKNNYIIGGSIILYDRRVAYYHLSANLDNKISGLTNAIIYEAYKYSKLLKLETFYLGGGNSNSKSDNLFKFKKKMSNQSHSYYIGKKIYNMNIYSKINKNWEKKYPKLINLYNNHILKHNYKK